MNDERRNSRPVTVLVADDSTFMRSALTRMIESDPSLQVRGTAHNGEEALAQIKTLRPDVVTLDVDMPGLNGLETLRRIMQSSPLPVIMVSSLTQMGAETTLEALACGAFDYVPKPVSGSFLNVTRIQDELIAKIKAAAVAKWPKPMASVGLPFPTPELRRPGSTQIPPMIVAVGISTGGPKALQEILPLLPADLPVGVLVVQHMPAGFTGPLASRLDNLCSVAVREAVNNDPILPGTIYIAPAGRHMTVCRRTPSQIVIRISEAAEHTLHVPSVDVMMLSVAEIFRAAAMGIIMTGMGNDGLKGMRAIAQAGGMTLGQDEASCAVYGMPRACAEDGVLQRIVKLHQIPEQILQAANYRRKSAV